ncbi:hypothetical protein HYV10_01015 [Candidatus Dependentiae bacterium]|nr:hypothetical protein [Candidatus Dependentiae bacterium]
MRFIIILFSLLYINYSSFLLSSQKNNDQSAEFHWTFHKKNSSGENLKIDNYFQHVTFLIEVLKHITHNNRVTHRWIFESHNSPTNKVLTIRKIDINTQETSTAIYRLSTLPHVTMNDQQSIWNCKPSIPNSIGLTETTFLELSRTFTDNRQSDSLKNLHDIIHVVTSGILKIDPLQSISTCLPMNDNRYTI